jgi:peptide/nickel transport system permease protein
MKTEERSEWSPVEDSSPTTPGERHKRGSDFWARFHRQPTALLCSCFLVVLVLVTLFANRLAPHDPFALSDDVLSPPSEAHLFGTDDLGPDVFSGVVHGTRVSLLVGVISAVASTVIGIVIGGFAGYFGGLVDDALMRLT